MSKAEPKQPEDGDQHERRAGSCRGARQARPNFPCHRSTRRRTLLDQVVSPDPNERSNIMSDPKKTKKISRKIQDISRSIQSRESNVDRIEREKNEKMRYYDQQIKRE